MNDRDALYAAILAHPDEDTPRLAYADWLEEHGEADHAAFIRKQIELSKVPEWDELAICDSYSHTSGKPVIEPRYYELDIPEPCSWMGQGGVQRGFQCGVEISTQDGPDSWVRAFSSVFRIAPVDTLEVWGEDNAISHWKEFVTTPHFAKVRKLTVSLVNLTIEQVRQLISTPHASGLRELKIAFDSEQAATAFFRSPLAAQLTSLTFRLRGDVGDKVTKAFHSLLRKGVLRSLSVNGTNGFWPALCAGPLDSLESITCFSTFQPGGVELLTRSLSGNSLRVLHLCGPVTDSGAAALAGCAALSELRFLWLEGCDVKSRGAQALAKSPHLKNLLRLIISQNKIGDGGATALIKSPHLANLLVLSFRGCGAGDKTGETVLASPLATRLLMLDLLSNSLTTVMKRKLSRYFKKRVLV